MGNFPFRAESRNQSASVRLRRADFCIVIVGLCLTGCGKPTPIAPRPSESATPPAAVEAAPAPPPAAESTDGATPAATPEGEEPSLAAVNTAVNAYIMGQLKTPDTLEDLVKAGYLKRLPGAPAGKKFALNAKKMAAVLVDK
jgi:hypothetical protein